MTTKHRTNVIAIAMVCLLMTISILGQAPTTTSAQRPGYSDMCSYDRFEDSTYCATSELPLDPYSSFWIQFSFSYTGQDQQKPQPYIVLLARRTSVSREHIQASHVFVISSGRRFDLGDVTNHSTDQDSTYYYTRDFVRIEFSTIAEIASGDKIEIKVGNDVGEFNSEQNREIRRLVELAKGKTLK